MEAVYVDANDTLAVIMERLRRPEDMHVKINRNPSIKSAEIPGLLDGAAIAIIGHTYFPTEIARECVGLKHVVYLGTGARSYMDPAALAAMGVAVHTIKGYGDTAVAESAIGLMWAASKGLAGMDREIRKGNWLEANGIQLTGKTLGLIGYGSVASEVARIAHGCGMKVLAWNRSRKIDPLVEFVSLQRVLTDSHVVSLHLAFSDETKGFLSRERIRAMRPGVILVNTARAALIDEEALIEALRSWHVGHAGLDVFAIEPIPAGNVLTTLPNVTLSAHSAWRTKEAFDNLVAAALNHCRRIQALDRGPVSGT